MITEVSRSFEAAEEDTPACCAPQSGSKWLKTAVISQVFKDNFSNFPSFPFPLIAGGSQPLAVANFHHFRFL